MSNDDPYAERRRLTFEQAEGVEPLPAQLQPKELSKELRALLWQLVYESLREDIDFVENRKLLQYFLGHWKKIIYDYYVTHEYLMADEFDNNSAILTKKLKALFSDENYTKVFGFLQFVIRHQRRPPEFAKNLDRTLSTGPAAYRVLDQRTIIPITSEAERETLDRAFADLAASEFRGARTHLHTAGSELTAGNYTSSIRESIHAVESVARTLAPSGKLGEALAKLEKSAAIHGGLKKGFLSIYGYTSDEQGIRHPLLDDSQPIVDEADALFMIGACAAFVSYMIHKARLAGLLTQESWQGGPPHRCGGL